MQVLASVLLLGTVHVQVLLGISILSIATGAWAAYTHRKHTGQWPTSPATHLIGALTIWTILQAVPWPSSIVAWLAPRNFHLWEQAHRAVGASLPSWIPLSLDPGASWVEALKGLTYLSAATSATVVTKQRGALWTAASVFFASLAAGLLTLGHGLLGAQKVYGLYQPINHFTAWHIGPLLNANHLAGYLNLGIFSGLGIAFLGGHHQRRAFALLGVLFGIAALFSTASRGAIAVFLFALLLLNVGLRSTLRRRKTRWLRFLPWAAAAGGAVLAVLGMTSGQWNELLARDLGKLDMMTWARPMIRDHLWVGVGRGAFESTFPAYRVTPNNVVYTHAENILVQWLSEWGVVVGGMALVAFVWLLLSRTRKISRNALLVGAWVGLVALVLQNLVDFSLEVPGVALSATVLLAALWTEASKTSDTEAEKPARDSSRPSWRPSWWRKRRAAPVRYTWAIVPPLLLTAVVWPMAVTKGIPPVSDQRRQLHDLVTSGPLPSPAVFHRAYREAVLRHPAEPYFSRLGAFWAWKSKRENPMPYLERTFRLSRIAGPAHLLTARILHSLGRYSQARLELRYAIRDDPRLGTPAVELAVRQPATFEDLSQIVPKKDPGHCVALNLLGAWLAGRNRQLGNKFDELAVRDCPQATGALSRLIDQRIRELSRDGAHHAKGCSWAPTRKACIARLLLLTDRLERLTPGLSLAQRLRARIWLATGDSKRARETLRYACDGVGDRLNCLADRLRIADETNDSPEVEKTLGELANAGCSNGTHCERGLMIAADYLSSHGRSGEAIPLYRRAAQRNPGNVRAWVKYGRAASSHGMHHAAQRAFEHALRLRPGDKNLQRAVEREKAATLTRFLQVH